MTPRPRYSAGDRLGRLVVVAVHPERVFTGERQYVCRCDCGQETVVRGCNLTSGATRSCGCLAREWAATMGSGQHVHGHTSRNGVRGETRTHASWHAMSSRCHNPNSDNYHNYGGRGIVVCDRWRGAGGFENFLADMGERPEGTTLDRLDPNGNYEKGNCRWATSLQQARENRRSRPGASPGGDQAEQAQTTTHRCEAS